MLNYIVRRVFLFLLTLWLTSMLIFTATYFLPGDVAGVILGREAPQAARDNLRHELGLDQPFIVQYVNWSTRFLAGDWGSSYAMRSPIQPLVMQRLGNSLRLALVAMLIAIVPAIALGVLAGLNE